MSRYIGKKSFIDPSVIIGVNTFIYGPSRIGNETIIDTDVVIGYPTRKKLFESRYTKQSHGIFELDEIFDELSEGSVIGGHCIIRRGTIIYERTVIGDYTETGHNVLIREDTKIGEKCRIGSYTIIDGMVTIGSNTVIQSNTYIPPKTVIGSQVFIAPRVVFTNDRYPPSKRLIETIVEDDVVIGANSTIIAGIKIGKSAVIAAGSVVTKSVEPYTVVAGVPAKPIMSREEYEKRKKNYENLVNLFPWK